MPARWTAIRWAAKYPSKGPATGRGLRNARSSSLLTAVVVAGGLLRIVPIWFGLPYLQARPDEETTIGHAVAIAGGDLNPHFFPWPSLTFYLVAALLKGASAFRHVLSLDAALTPAQMILITRGLVALAGTFTLVWMFRIGRRVGGETSGLLAALLLAISILHVRESHFAMTDVLMVLFVVISLDLLLRALDSARDSAHAGDAVWRFALAGLSAGLATSTKYSAAALVAPMVTAQLMLVNRDRPGRSVAAGAGWLPSIAFIGAGAVAFLAATPYAILDWPRFSTDFELNVSHLSHGHVVDLGRGWSYHLRRSLPYGAGLPTFVAAVLGIVPLVRERRESALVLAVFAAALYACIGSGQTVFFRYTLPIVPVVCVFAAAGVQQIALWTASAFRQPARVALALTIALVALPSLVNCVWFDALLARTDTRVLAADWLVARAQPAQSVYEAPDPYSELQLGRALHRWAFDPATESFVNAGGRIPDWLVLHESPVWTYARIPPALRRLAADRYALAYEIRATRGAARSAVYDLQDAFFLPVSGFSTIARPGPTVFVYRRVK